MSSIDTHHMLCCSSVARIRTAGCYATDSRQSAATSDLSCDADFTNHKYFCSTCRWVKHVIQLSFLLSPISLFGTEWLVSTVELPSVAVRYSSNQIKSNQYIY